MSKEVGDLNMRLKLEIGALKEENENVTKKNAEIKNEMRTLEARIQVC